MGELFLGLTLGWTAGISPGPLTALIVTTTLRKGFGGGARVAVAPLITDLPVIVATVTALAAMSEGVVKALGVAGGLYLVWLGVREVRSAADATLSSGDAAAGAVDVRHGAITNILNPQMWLFWVTVGAPIVTSADSAGAAAMFLGSFYLLLIGTKLGLAGLVSRTRDRVFRAGWASKMAVIGGLGLTCLGVGLVVRAW